MSCRYVAVALFRNVPSTFSSERRFVRTSSEALVLQSAREVVKKNAELKSQLRDLQGRVHDASENAGLAFLSGVFFATVGFLGVQGGPVDLTNERDTIKWLGFL